MFEPVRAARVCLTTFAGAAQHGLEAAFHVVAGGRPRRDADAHARVALPHGDARPAGSISLNGLDDLSGSFRVAAANHDLVSNDFFRI